MNPKIVRYLNDLLTSLKVKGVFTTLAMIFCRTSSITHGRKTWLLLTSSLARKLSWVRKTLIQMDKLSTELERSIRIGPVDFIASLGGLFGLCLGFSIISFLEIVYWAAIGFFRNVFNK